MARRTITVLAALLCSSFLARAQMATVGEEVRKTYETPHPYAAAREGSSDLVWRDEISFAGASYIAPHFARFHLADGDYVILRSPDGARSWRYDHLGKGERGEASTGFWGTHLPGDTMVVELHGKGGGEFGYTIDRFARGYRLEETVPLGPESVCGLDDSNWAMCYQSSEPRIYEKARAVARLTILGTRGCTGWLVGNAGHVLTNAHCITSTDDAADTDFEFMAEGATCQTDCSGVLSCPGTIVANAATLVQLDVPLDYALVLLPSNPVPTYGFLKMRSGPAFVDERIYVPGHPASQGKKIAVASSDPFDQSGYCEIRDLTTDPSTTCIPSATQLDVGYMCDTADGSSGSPVLAYADHKVVALHHCGGCSNSGVTIQNVITSLGANLPPGSTFEPVGTVALSQDLYGCSSTISIDVKDDNLAGAGSQSVTIHSTTEPLDETVVLNETPSGSGWFVGSIATTSASASHGDAQLSVVSGATITVTYLDADDGTGHAVNRTDTALADCVAPVITNVHAINVTGNSADVLWDTNEPTTSLVTFGLSAAPPPTSTTSSAALVTSHSVHLTGVLPCRSYIYKVASTDGAGNSTQNDNGGIYYAFTLGPNTNPTYAASGLPMSIPDFNTNGAIATINVADPSTIVDVNVKVKVTHTYDGDLTLSLIAPGGQTILLANHRGNTGDNFTDTIFDDAAATSISIGASPFTGSYRPEQPLTAYNGMLATGTWSLKVVDSSSLDTGTLDKFELTFAYAPQICGPDIHHLSHTVADDCTGAGAGDTNGVVDPGELLTIPVQLRNTGSDTASSVAAVLSSATPGVTVTQNSASYGPINPNQSASGNVPYTVQLSESIPCGTLVAFDLHATSPEGSWTDSFTTRVGTIGTSTSNYVSTDVPKPILDAATTSSVVTVPTSAIVTDVNVNLTLAHTYDSDLVLTLIGPNGTQVPLAASRGGSGANFTNTTFDDAAATAISSGFAPFNGTYRPETPLSALNGIPANGTWTLRIEDTSEGDSGTLFSWKVVLTVQSGFTCNGCTPAPGEVLNLKWSAPQTAFWASTGGASEYRLYRGVNADLPKLLNASIDSCRRATTASVSQTGLTEAPPLQGTFYWWIVRAANAGGEGPPGNATAGPRTLDSSGVCP